MHKWAVAILCALAATRSVDAFRGSVPLIVAQGIRDDTLKVDATSMHRQDVFETVKGMRCPEVALVVEQQSLHASDISQYAAALKNVQLASKIAKSTLSVPYVFGADGLTDEITEALMTKCDMTLQDVAATDKELVVEEGKTTIFRTRLPNFKGRSDMTEAEAIAVNDKLFGQLTDSLRDISNEYLIVFTSGTSSRHLARRKNSEKKPTNVPFAKRAFLTKYIIFNTGIFEGSIALVLVSLVSLIGINALSAIQGPTKFETKRD
ncbi:hypothetical protein HDU67_007776 [Dinochytrium kinnereticum]|nr:hypothetical protein HDU67_007776 [Dinochytrium kinnereticum]